MLIKRSWTVLLVGGASGTGKTRLADGLGRHYGVNVFAVDDLVQALKATTTSARMPALHGGGDWLDIGVAANVQWLRDVSAELAPGIKAVVDNHLEEDTPVIIEGDFLVPAFAASLQVPGVRALFVCERDTEQLVRNYLAREGGEEQRYRAAISAAYTAWLSAACAAHGIPVVEARPWRTAVERAAASL